jgi:drug/metabolite transporter (DMT)-like permease
MKLRFLLALIGMNCLWAATLITFKVLAPWLDAGGIVTFRYGLAALACAVLWRWLPGAAPRGRDLVRAMVMGVIVFSLGPRLQTAGVQMGQASDAAVLMALEPLLCAVAAALLLHEHIDPRRWVGFGFGILGVLLISEAWQPQVSWGPLTANSLILASFLAETAYSVMGKPIIERAGPFRVLAVGLFAATVVNLVWEGNRIGALASQLPPSAWGMLLYLSLVCTVFGYGLWFIVIRETPVNVTALTIFVQPVAGVFLAVLWLDEKLHWGQLWGTLTILAGLVLGLWKKNNKDKH